MGQRTKESEKTMGAEELQNANPLMDKRLVTAFVDGVLKTLSSMASTQATPLKPFVDRNSRKSGEVAGLIGMISGEMKGNITVSFTKEAVFQILQNMLDETYETINDEVGDAVGELTNMIYGSAKTTLNQMGYSFEMAIPTVLLGETKILSFHSAATLVIPFELEGEKKFFVELTVQT